jgi:type II secretory pathway predicted ATPase ExeA
MLRIQIIETDQNHYDPVHLSTLKGICDAWVSDLNSKPAPKVIS